MNTRFQNLIALYVPSSLYTENAAHTIQEYFYDGTSNVNIFRGVLTLLTDKNIPALKDLQFFVAKINKKWIAKEYHQKPWF